MEDRSTNPVDEAVPVSKERADPCAEPSAVPLTIQRRPLATQRRLGQREREVMSILWALGDATVQQVSTRLSSNLAYTTVMTTLDRLFKKGLLRRKKSERAFIYSTALTPRQVEGQRAAALVRHFFSDSREQPELLLSCLLDAVEEYDTALLDKLEASIRAARAGQPASAIEAPDAKLNRERDGVS